MEEITLRQLEEIQPAGVALGFLDPSKVEEIAQLKALLFNTAKNDFKFAYSYSNFFNIEPVNDNESNFAIKIYNYGDVDAELVYLRLVIWKYDGVIIEKRFKQVLTIKATQSEVFESTLRNKEDLGVIACSEILNAYVIVADPVSDPFDPILAKFIKNGYQPDQEWSLLNPCRYSRKIASLNLSTYSVHQFDPFNLPFEVKGNAITCKASGHFDIVLESIDATDNASFGMLQNGKAIILIDSINDKNKLNKILLTVPSTETDLVFILFTRNNRLSTNPAYCRITNQGKCREIELRWEDSNEPHPDYNDFIIKILHR